MYDVDVLKQECWKFQLCFDSQLFTSAFSSSLRPCSRNTIVQTPYALLFSDHDFATLLPFAFFFGVSLMDKPDHNISLQSSSSLSQTQANVLGGRLCLSFSARSESFITSVYR